MRLSVVLEARDSTVTVGQPIRGTVEVDASDSGGKCDGLVVKAEWHTHGRGNVRTGGGDPVELFRGEWAKGDRRSYPFELPGVDGPLPYHGTEVNLDWRVVATADIPWAIDPKAEAELVLVRGERPPRDLKQLVVPQEVPELTTQQALTCVVPFVGLFFLLPGLGMAIYAGAQVSRGDLTGLPMLFFGLLFAGVAGVILFFSVRNRIAAAKLGDVDLRVSPSPIEGGQELKVTLGFRPGSDVTLNGVTAKLVGLERAIRGSGTNKKTFVHQLHEEQAQLREAGPVRRMQDVALKTTFRIPERAAPSLAVADNEVLWQVAVHIDIAGWPDWARDVPVTVLPT